MMQNMRPAKHHIILRRPITVQSALPRPRAAILHQAVSHIGCNAFG
jgi:hypothetical protein